MATLAKLLQVDMGLPDMAKRLAAAGRGKDSILAHINPKEMALLKKHGGSGKTNPRTGIMEFNDYDSGNYGETGGYDTSGYSETLPQQEVTSRPNVEGPVLSGEPFTPAAPETAPAAPAPDSGIDTLSKENLAHPQYQSVKSSVAAPAPVEQAGLPIRATQSLPNYLAGVGGSEFGTPESIYPTKEEEPSYAQRFANYIKPVTSGAETLTKALDPLAPYAKFGTQAFGIYQANKAANETREQSARNEAEIRALADPYRQQAALMQQQGQQMLAAGQAGQLTPQQQQDLERRRATALQQQAAAGVSGGTAAQQIEADIQRTAQSYAQQNISQGLALMSQAQNVAGTADTLVKQAITAGYSGSQDANKLASEFYNAIGFSLPQTSSKGPTNA